MVTFCGNEIGFCSGYIPPDTLITSPFTANAAAALTVLSAVLGLLPSFIESSPSSATYITLSVLAPAPTHAKSPPDAPRTDPIPAVCPLESKNVPPI